LAVNRSLGRLVNRARLCDSPRVAAHRFVEIEQSALVVVQLSVRLFRRSEGRQPE